MAGQLFLLRGKDDIADHESISCCRWLSHYCTRGPKAGISFKQTRGWWGDLARLGPCGLRGLGENEPLSGQREWIMKCLWQGEKSNNNNNKPSPLKKIKYDLISKREGIIGSMNVSRKVFWFFFSLSLALDIESGLLIFEAWKEKGFFFPLEFNNAPVS